jgi:glycosyltransferase involved in cell wall biosynthesis
MKIVIPMTRSTLSDTVKGGVEKFIKTLHETFEVVPVFYDESIFDKSQKEQKIYQKTIIEEILNINPDLVIMNGYRGNKSFFNNKAIQELNIPVMHIDHYIVHFPGHDKKVQSLYNNNQTVFCVSPYHKEFVESEMKRMSKEPTVPSINGFIYPEYARKVEVKEPEFDLTTIGRMCPDKNPMLLAKYCDGTDLTHKIFSNMEFEDYYKRNEKYNRGNVILNLPHKDIMEQSSKARVFLSTWDKETFGITALEAASAGLPLILSCGKNMRHSSECIVADESFYGKVRKNDKESFIIEYERLAKLDRKEIAESTQDKHSFDKWKARMEDAMQFTLDKANKKTGLELFY